MCVLEFCTLYSLSEKNSDEKQSPQVSAVLKTKAQIVQGPEVCLIKMKPYVGSKYKKISVIVVKGIQQLGLIEEQFADYFCRKFLSWPFVSDICDSYGGPTYTLKKL